MAAIGPEFWGAFAGGAVAAAGVSLARWTGLERRLADLARTVARSMVAQAIERHERELHPRMLEVTPGLGYPLTPPKKGS